MFVTFQTLNGIHTNNFLWWFGQVYLYACISFFTYVVLNLFIGVILDAYYAIKVPPIVASQTRIAMPNQNVHSFTKRLQPVVI